MTVLCCVRGYHKLRGATDVGISGDGIDTATGFPTLPLSKPVVEWYKISLSLKYEPASDPLHRSLATGLTPPPGSHPYRLVFKGHRLLASLNSRLVSKNERGRSMRLIKVY